MRRLNLLLCAGLLVGACGTASSSLDSSGSTTPSAVAGSTSTEQLPRPTGEPSSTQSVGGTVSERFGAAINRFTVEPDLPSNEADWLAEHMHFFVVGKLVSVEPGPIRDGYWMKLTCEASEGVPIPGDCSKLVQYRGVVLTIEASDRRTLTVGRSQTPLSALVEVEFLGPYTALGGNRENTDRGIAEVIESAPIGENFALFVGLNSWGLQSVVGTWTWGWVDDGVIRPIPGATKSMWTSGSESVASILAMVDSKGATK